MIDLDVLVADDEPLARERLTRLLVEAGCRVIEVLEDGVSLLNWIRANAGTRVDVLFLDIQMPGLNGLETLAELRHPPLTVFVTAFSNYAIQAFEAAAVDYLLKPVYPDRLAKTLERVRASKVRKLTAADWKAMLPSLPRVSIKAGFGIVLMDLERVTHFELEDERVWAVTPGERLLTTWTSLKEVEELFPEAGMLRIQRHLLLRPEAVSGCRGLLGGRLKVRLPKGQELVVSRAMAPMVKQRLALD